MIAGGAIGLLIGAAVGALTPRVAYRLSVPWGEPARAGCSECELAFAPGWAGWVAVSRPCRGCGVRLGPRAWVLATVGGVAGAGMGYVFGSPWIMAIYLLATVVGLLLAAIDLACLRLPDKLVLPLFVVCAAALTVVAAIYDAWSDLGRAGIAAVVLAGGYLLLGIIVPGGLGLGDVKLALVLGLLLGWLGWGFVLLAVLVTHVVQGGVAIVAVVTRGAGRRTLIPMGPALFVGAWCAVVIPPIIVSAVHM